jgi:ankyrin repeat protein
MKYIKTFEDSIDNYKYTLSYLINKHFFIITDSHPQDDTIIMKADADIDRINRNLNRIQELIKNKISLETEYQDMTPLVAATWFKFTDIQKDLIKAGVNIDKSSCYTPLMVACRNNSYIGAKNLIDAGAKLNIQDKNWKNTALHLSASSYRQEILKELINAGANLNLKNHYGNTPLVEAASSENKRHWKLKYQIISELIKAGADTNIKNNNRKDFFSYLTSKQEEELLKKFPKEFEDYIMKKNAKKYNL